MMRGAILAVALFSVGALLVLTVLSGLVLALFAFGIVGALLHPPDR